MEFCDNGDLFEKVSLHKKRASTFSEEEIWTTIIQALRGLNSVHKLDILHRDIKSANIFMNKDGTVKLGDMNVSKVAKNGLLSTQTGTPYQASPEVWRDKPYDCKSDIWSLGCVLQEMCALRPPFRAEDMQGLQKKVIKGQQPRIPSTYSNDLSTVIKHMLQVSASTRLDTYALLKLPCLVIRMKKYNLLKDEPAGDNELLKTIRMNNNLFVLTKQLPKSAYSGDRELNEQDNDNKHNGSDYNDIQMMNGFDIKLDGNSKKRSISNEKLRRPESHAQLRRPESNVNLKIDLHKINNHEGQDMKVIPKIYLKNNNNNNNNKIRDLASNTSVQSIVQNREYLPLKKLSLNRDQSLKKNKLEDLSHNNSKIDEIIDDIAQNVNSLGKPNHVQIKKDKVKLLLKINNKQNLLPKYKNQSSSNDVVLKPVEKSIEHDERLTKLIENTNTSSLSYLHPHKNSQSSIEKNNKYKLIDKVNQSVNLSSPNDKKHLTSPLNKRNELTSPQKNLSINQAEKYTNKSDININNNLNSLTQNKNNQSQKKMSLQPDNSLQSLSNNNSMLRHRLPLTIKNNESTKNLINQKRQQRPAYEIGTNQIKNTSMLPDIAGTNKKYENKMDQQIESNTNSSYILNSRHRNTSNLHKISENTNINSKINNNDSINSQSKKVNEKQSNQNHIISMKPAAISKSLNNQRSTPNMLNQRNVLKDKSLNLNKSKIDVNNSRTSIK